MSKMTNSYPCRHPVTAIARQKDDPKVLYCRKCGRTIAQEG
jgi:hypothetical protein